MQQAILDTITQAMLSKQRVALIVEGLHPISSGTVTELDLEQKVLVLVAPMYDTFTQQSQLHKYVLSFSTIKGVGITLLSIESNDLSTVEGFLDDDDDDGFFDLLDEEDY